MSVVFTQFAVGNGRRQRRQKTPSVRRKDFFPRAFFLQADRFGRAEFGGEENSLVAVALGVDHFGDHFGIQLEYLGADLQTLGVTLALRSVHRYFHFLSNIN
jgi:hypothetical protein